MPVSQTITNQERRLRGETPETSKRVGDTPPPIITKKWLFCHFEISQTNRTRLYRLVLTAEVLAAIGLRESEVRRRGFQCFTAVQSKLLVKILFQ